MMRSKNCKGIVKVQLEPHIPGNEVAQLMIKGYTPKALNSI